MADTHSPEQRSFNMSRIKERDTKPEMVVRSLVHQLGFRFRLHRKDLPGKPDLVFPSRKKIIFVHGCFWHMHDCRYGRVVPKTNDEYWRNKRQGNVERDKKNLAVLQELGWRVLILWECQVKYSENLDKMLMEFLSA